MISDIGFACLRAGMRPPRLGSLLTRYHQQWQVKRLLDKLKVTTVLDVGGSNGMYARGIRKLGFQGRIESFEPIPGEMAEARKLNISDFRWRGHETAIGSVNGQATFNVIRQEDQTAFFSSFLEPAGAPGRTETRTVQVARLDSFRFPDARIFLKSDTQGHDLEVLKGCGDLIQSVVMLQMELSVIPQYKGQPHYLEALAYLESLGFGLMGLNVVDWDDQGKIKEYDCLMIR